MRIEKGKKMYVMKDHVKDRRGRSIRQKSITKATRERRKNRRLLK